MVFHGSDPVDQRRAGIALAHTGGHGKDTLLPHALRHSRSTKLRTALFLTLAAAVVVAWLAGLLGREAFMADRRQHILEHEAERIALVLDTTLAERREALATTAQGLAETTDLRNRLVWQIAASIAEIDPIPSAFQEAAPPSATPASATAAMAVPGREPPSLRALGMSYLTRFDLAAIEVRIAPQMNPILRIEAPPIGSARKSGHVASALPADPTAILTLDDRTILTGASLVFAADGGVLGSVVVSQELAQAIGRVETATGSRSALYAPGTLTAEEASPVYRHAAFAGNLPRPMPGEAVWHVAPDGSAFAISTHRLPTAMIPSDAPILVVQTEVTADEAAFRQELVLDRVILTAMALVMSILVGGLWFLVRRNDVSRRDRDRLAFALDASGEGLWEWDVRTDRVTLSPRWQTLFNVPGDPIGSADERTGDVTVSLQALRGTVHPDDLPGMLRALDEHWRGLSDLYRFAFRVRAGEGWAWVLDRGRIAERNRRGEVVRMIGTQADITDLKRAQARLETAERLHREMFERSTAPMLLTERDTGAIRDANEAAYLFYGWSRSTLKRMNIAELEALPADEIARR